MSAENREETVKKEILLRGLSEIYTATAVERRTFDRSTVRSSRVNLSPSGSESCEGLELARPHIYRWSYASRS